MRNGQKNSSIDTNSMNTSSSIMYNMLLAIGVCVSVIIVVILGIKYMTSTVDGKAEMKETLIPYIVGCVVMFGAFTIWKIVVIALQSIS